MKHAETVTFGGSGMDRAAHLRGPAQMPPDGRTITLWRGKALMGKDGLIWLGADDAALPATLFLGVQDGPPLWARDLSALPPEQADRLADGFGARFADLRAEMAALTTRDAESWATARSLFEWHRHHGFCAACGAPGTVVQSGWQRDCPACGRMHFPRTDPVVIMLVTHGNDVLLGRSPGWPEGMYSLLAGYVEPGETMESAVRRELREETGILCGAVDYLASQPWPFPSSLMLGCAAQAVTRNITPDPAELEDALWISRERLALAFAGLGEPALLPARPGSIAHFLLRNWLADRLW